MKNYEMLLIIMFLVQSVVYSQGKLIESKVYKWDDMVAEKRPQGESRQILEGTTNPIALKYKQIEMAEQNENLKNEQIYQDVMN